MKTIRILALVLSTAFLAGCPWEDEPGGPTGPAVGINATLVVQNDTNTSIWYVYISPCSSSSWGSDRLGSNTIPSGTSRSWSVAPGCTDVKAVTRDNREATNRLTLVSGETFTWRLY